MDGSTWALKTKLPSITKDFLLGTVTTKDLKHLDIGAIQKVRESVWTRKYFEFIPSKNGIQSSALGLQWGFSQQKCGFNQPKWVLSNQMCGYCDTIWGAKDPQVCCCSWDSLGMYTCLFWVASQVDMDNYGLKGLNLAILVKVRVKGPISAGIYAKPWVYTGYTESLDNRSQKPCNRAETCWSNPHMIQPQLFGFVKRQIYRKPFIPVRRVSGCIEVKSSCVVVRRQSVKVHTEGISLASMQEPLGMVPTTLYQHIFGKIGGGLQLGLPHCSFNIEWYLTQEHNWCVHLYVSLGSHSHISAV